MAANYPWPDQNAPQQQGFSLPVSIGPMSLPVEKPKRRWRGLVAWSLCLFAVGVASGPLLTEYAYRAIEAGGAFMAVNAPAFLRPYLPLPVDPSAPPVVAPRSRPSVPGAEVARAPSEPARPAPAPAPAPEPDKAAPERVAAVEPAAHGAKGKHGKSAAKTPPSETAPAAPPPAAPVARKAGKSHDPFDTGSPEPAPAKAKATPEPAARPSKSADGLDSLMAGGVSDDGGKSKAKRSTSKDIDAMLKDVQKSDPAPAAPKRAEKTDLPQLTSSDIARVMGGVKTRANACGQRLGQKGVAELKLNVGKDGRISDVSVGGKVAGTPLAECIEKVARAATFQPNAGLKFDYRIDVR